MAKTAPEFERSFADLSYSYINNNAPKILDYMVGFQVLDAEDDETYAIGVFGFSIGGTQKDMFYAPVIFTGGKLKGQELLYHAKSDMFLPLNEPWVDFILNKKPIEIGQSTGERVPSLAQYLPNFRDLLGRGMAKGSAVDYDPSRSPVLTGNVLLGREFDITPALGMFLSREDRVKSATTNLDFAKVVKDHPELFDEFAHRMRTSDSFAKCASAFYTVEDFLGVEAPPVVVKQAAVAPQAAPVRKNAPHPRVYTGETAELLAKSASDKEQLTKFGYIVIDDRDSEDAKSLVEGTASFYGPTEVGYYDFITSGGKVERLLYFPKSHYLATPMVLKVNKSGNKHMSIILDGSQSYATLTPEPVEPLDISVFEAVSAYTDKDAYDLWVIDAGHTPTRVPWRGVTISDKVGRIIKPSMSSSALIVPPTARCFEIKMDPTSELTPIPIDEIPLEYLFPRGTFTVKEASGDYLEFTTPSGMRKLASSFLEALTYLVEDQGLTKDAAEYAISRAIVDNQFTYAIKQGAYTIIDDYYPEAPVFNDDANIIGSDAWSGASITEDSAESKPVLGLPMSTVRSHGAFEPDVDQVMQSAVNTKQKDIFDVSALSSLIESTDVGNIIDKYLPDMVKSVDKIGRSLFSLYVHTQAFEERYGAEDLADLEGTLKNAFDIVGKLVLFMKKRSIGPDSDNTSAVDLADTAD